MGVDDYLDLTDEELLRQCGVDTLRGSGPGGQKRNKTESAVRLRHGPTGLVAQSDETRSQHQNKARALRQLRLRIALELRRPQTLEGYQPPEALRAWIAGGGRATTHLAAVAALLDLFVACACSVRDTARVLGLSTGALSRLLLSDEKLAATVNRLRAGAGLRPLR